MIKEKIQKIVEDWFLTEPALFVAWCTHSLVQNDRLAVPMRCGKQMIEFNPKAMEGWTDQMIAERLKFEVLRILLGHPYMRQPYKARKGPLGLASDITLKTLYKESSTLPVPSDLYYPQGKCFEEYYSLVMNYVNRKEKDTVSPPYDIDGGLLDDGGGGTDDEADSKNDSASSDDSDENSNPSNDTRNEQKPQESGSTSSKKYPSDNQSAGNGNDNTEAGNNASEDNDRSCGGEDDEIEGGGTDDSDEESGSGNDTEVIDNKLEYHAETAELWEEDQMMQEVMRNKIEQVKKQKQWGSLPGNVIDEIIAATIVKIDYRRILSMFRGTILSSKRKLTRMNPSRRYGFEYMGSKREFSTRLLVAIDVSGSVDNKQIAQSLSIINRFFKYGVEDIGVVQFDYGLQGDIITMRKALKKEFKVYGRGGTDFQAPIDLFLTEKYDGLVMITDGYANIPSVPKNFKGNILWMIYEDSFFGTSRLAGLSKDLDWIKEFPKSKYVIMPPV